MAKIHFDIKFRPQVESGEYKVETRDGRHARIICWDARADDGACIIALIPGYGGEEAYQFFPDGHAFSSKSSDEDCADLFLITPEPEPLTKLEKAVFDMLVERTNEATISETQARKYGPIFMEIAKDEIYSHESLVEYAKKARAEGKAEALKDLPRWVKVDEGDMLDKYSKYLLRSNEGCYYYCGGTTITRDGYMLLVDNLEKLPKEGEI